MQRPLSANKKAAPEPEPKKQLPWEKKALPAKEEKKLPALAKPKVQQNDADAWGDDWNFDDFDKDEIPEDFDYKNQNLNVLSDEALQKHKTKMDEKFNKNYVGPNNPNFKYDVQKDFSKEPKEENSWDEDLSDNEFDF